MLLKRGIKIRSAKTRLNWLRKWAMWAVTEGKISAFYCKPLNRKITNHKF